MVGSNKSTDNGNVPEDVEVGAQLLDEDEALPTPTLHVARMPNRATNMKTATPILNKQGR